MLSVSKWDTVVIVTDHAFIDGGVANVAFAEALGLAKRGVRVIFIASAGPIDAKLTDVGIEVVCAEQKDLLSQPSLSAAWQGVYNRKACRLLQHKLTELDPRRTIVHFHSWARALSPAIFGIPRAQNFVSILTLHDYFLTCPNGAFLDFKRSEICKRRPLSFDCLKCNCDSRHRAHKYWRFFRTGMQNHFFRITKKLDAIVSVSAFNRDRILPHLSSAPPIHIVRNPAEIPPQKRVIAETNDVFLFVGRLSATKGPVVFAEAARRANVKTCFVGDGELREEIVRILPDAKMLGWLQGPGVQDAMTKARSLVFPSIWYEAQPLTPLEAMAKGVPVVSSDENAATEVVEKKNGWIFSNGDVQALANTLSEISKNSSEVAKRSKEAYAWYWNDPWTTESHLDRLTQVFDQTHGHR